VTEPTASIVIPTRRRPSELAACLDSLARLDYPRDRLEVVVVDDGGGTPLDDVVDGVRDRLDVVLLTQEQSGPAAARNTGARRARGELLAFIDDDCLADPGWLRRLGERFAREPELGLGGRTVNALPRNPYATASQLVITVGYDLHNADPDDARFFASNNMAFPREAFLAAGGFDETFVTAEDRELCARWRLLGRRLAYVDDAVALHASDLGPASFCRQFFRYGQGAFRFRRHELRRTGRRAPLALWFHVDLLRRAIGDRSLERRPAVVALLLVWHVANMAGFLSAWAADRPGRTIGPAVGRERDEPLGRAGPHRSGP
jgi:GT2 family glycosyltransferase